MNIHQAFAAGMQAAESAGGPWWLPTGITQSDVVQAFQPKGAVSAANSLLDLSGNSNDASVAFGSLSWNSTDGWVFDGSLVLDSGVTVGSNTDWSAFVRYSDTSDVNEKMTVLGIYEDASGPAGEVRFRLELDFDESQRLVAINSSNYHLGPGEPLSGVIGMSGGNAYHSDPSVNFVRQSDLTYGSSSSSYYIGGARRAESNLTRFEFDGKIQAVAVYNKALTTAQVNQLMAAMNAL